MMKRYRYTIEGIAAGDQSWSTTGEVECELPDAFANAMADSFDQLTQGKAVFGRPGVGCRGPYDIRRVVIERLESRAPSIVSDDREREQDQKD